MLPEEAAMDGMEEATGEVTHGHDAHMEDAAGDNGDGDDEPPRAFRSRRRH